MENNSKIVWVSVIGNIVLAVVLVLFIAFGRTKPIEEYDTEIATLKTENTGLVDDNKALRFENTISNERYNDLDKEYNITLEDLKTSDDIIARLRAKRPKNGKSNYVDNLSDDAIIGEFTKYFERRVQRNN